MITKRAPFIFSIIVLSLEFIYTIIMLFIEKLGSQIDYLILALWSLPLIPLVIMSLIGLIIVLFHPEVRKKATAVIIMRIVAIVYFGIYVICLGFLVGTGHLPHYYFINGF